MKENYDRKSCGWLFCNLHKKVFQKIVMEKLANFRPVQKSFYNFKVENFAFSR